LGATEQASEQASGEHAAGAAGLSEGGGTIGRVTEAAVAVHDPWQTRLDRMRRLLPLPLLLLSAAAARAVPGGEHPWARRELEVLFAVAAALLWAPAVLRPQGPHGQQGPYGGRRRAAVFWTHTALAGALVWVNTGYGLFAYTGFLHAYGLGPRARTAGFAATGLIVSASLSGGYPTGDPGRAAGYLLVAGVLLALVLNSASITNRAVEQNRERGRMIDELAEATRRLEASTAENAELHARLLAQAREAGVVEERRRLAGEIHDTLAQDLTGIVSQLEAAEHIRHRPEESARHLARARALARAGLTEARRSVRALRPEQLEGAALPEAVTDLARDWSRHSSVAADVDTVGTPVRAPADVEAAVFRVAQEALSNVAKHARATAVRLTLTYLDGTLLLDVVDDGDGFTPRTPSGGEPGGPPGRPPGGTGGDSGDGGHGFGLVGMRERLARVRGTLTVDSAPGAGTTLNASVPLAGSRPGELPGMESGTQPGNGPGTQPGKGPGTQPDGPHPHGAAR